MSNISYTQYSIRFPHTKERYRQAIACMNERDRALYPTQADYLTSAILFFEGNISDERTSNELLLEEIKALGEKIDRLLRNVSASDRDQSS